MGANISINGDGKTLTGRIICTVGTTDGNVVTKLSLNNLVMDGNNTYSQAVTAQNQASAAVSQLHLTMTGCTVKNYANKGLYLTNATALTIDGCTFTNNATTDMNDPNTYGDYTIDLNLCAVQNAKISITNCTFTGICGDMSPIKVTQRGGTSESGDQSSDITTPTKASIDSLTISGCDFSGVSGNPMADIILGSSPYNDQTRTYCGKFAATITANGETKVLERYRGENAFVELSNGQTVSKTASGNLTLETVQPSNPGSSSSSSSTTYSPTLDVSDGGTIKVSPRTPEAGDKVTITPDPDNGYEVGEVTVTDRSGDAVRVTANRDGTYTFTQPRGRVTIEVTFVRAGESAFFDDVPASFWAYDEIAWAYDNGYVNGTSAATFSPNSSITRQQVWMILARLSGADPASMAAAREWAMVNDISDGTNPGNAVTRQQLVALLYRYAQLMGYDNSAREALSSFPDAGTVSGYAQEPMQWSVANGIVAGTSAGTLNPTGTATRAQFAVILYRFWDQVG